MTFRRAVFCIVAKRVQRMIGLDEVEQVGEQS